VIFPKARCVFVMTKTPQARRPLVVGRSPQSADLRAEAETAILLLSPFGLIALATGSAIEQSHPKACPEFVQSPR